ncbi:MAG: HAMP domain-containing histidine kinase [Saprospiraceae bacterium]|nr:HAMP domain-containing histidine kinase [Saprospiraceae bacterium]
MQIRTKLTLQFIFIVALLLIISHIFIYITFSNKIKSEFYKSLESKALMTAEMLVKNHSLTPIEPIIESAHSEDIILPSKEKILIYNSSFQKVYAFNQSDFIPESVLKEIRKANNLKFRFKEYEALGLNYKNKLNEDYILVSQAMFVSDDLDSLRNILIISFFVVIFFVGIGGMVFAKQTLSPIARIMNQLDEVFPSQIGKRLAVNNTKDELSRLSATFNKLLDRTEDTFLTQKGFLSNISHEIKNPLTTIITQLDVALERERSVEEYRSTLNSISADMLNMKDITEQLMHLARISSDDHKVVFENLRLDEIIWQVKSEIRKNHSDYSFRINTDSLPDNSDSLIISGNEQLVKLSIGNLLINACKFSPDHTAGIRLFISDENLIAVEISDKGPVIKMEERDLIFKPFYRSPATSHIKGTGIGLPLVNNILKLHKATVRITSSEYGNIFTVYFPQVKPV